MKHDLIGKTYGRLTVIEESGINKFNRVLWNCKCECGKTKIIASNCLISGHTKSCGCLHNEILVKDSTTHGKTHTPEYDIWCGIKKRCYNTKTKSYKDYGGRGIKVCDRWLNSFPNFIDDVGKRPSNLHSIDRYPDVNGDYEPGNTRWALRKEQNGNKRNNHWIEHMGKRMILQDWANFMGVREYSICEHLRKKTFSEVFDYYEKKKYKIGKHKMA